MENKISRNILVFLIMFLFIIQAFCYTVDAESTFYHTNPKGEFSILIDPGHGGIDGGAETKDGIVEKDINLKISIKLRDILKKHGYKVFMTRNGDFGLYTDGGRIRKKKIEDLANRSKMKKDTSCSMFVSIHLNMFPESKYRGAQVWYSKNEKSKQLAGIMQKNLINDLDKSNTRCEKPALNLYKILRDNDTMPSVIVECGFLSNYDERQKLISDDYQNKIASSLLKSVDEYYGSINN